MAVKAKHVSSIRHARVMDPAKLTAFALKPVMIQRYV